MDSPSIVPVESSTPEPPSSKTEYKSDQAIHDAHIGCHCCQTLRLNPNTNIGNNKIIKLPFTNIKKVMGIGQSFFLFLLIYLAMFSTVLIWVVSNGSFFLIPTYVIGVTLYLLTAYYMLLCFTTEPGIIPRNHPDYSSKELSSLLNESDEENKNIKDESKIKPSIFKEKICETCNIIRPPKTSHCRHCDNCVQNLDQ